MMSKVRKAFNVRPLDLYAAILKIKFIEVKSTKKGIHYDIRKED